MLGAAGPMGFVKFKTDWLGHFSFHTNQAMAGAGNGRGPLLARGEVKNRIRERDSPLALPIGSFRHLKRIKGQCTQLPGWINGGRRRGVLKKRWFELTGRAEQLPQKSPRRCCLRQEAAVELGTHA